MDWPAKNCRSRTCSQIAWHLLWLMISEHSIWYLPGSITWMYSCWVKMACTGNSPPYISPDLHKLDLYFKLFLFNFCAKRGFYFHWLAPVQLNPYLRCGILPATVMLPAEAFEMRICLLNLSMANEDRPLNQFITFIGYIVIFFYVTGFVLCTFMIFVQLRSQPYTGMM